jgi:hypothetical protein
MDPVRAFPGALKLAKTRNGPVAPRSTGGRGEGKRMAGVTKERGGYQRLKRRIADDLAVT